MLLMAYNKYLPEGGLFMLWSKIDSLSDSQISLLYAINFKDPTIALILSLFVGGLGVDRFYIGDTGLGVLKLITCGGFGVWAIIDLFLIMNATKNKNFDKLLSIMP